MRLPCLEWLSDLRLWGVGTYLINTSILCVFSLPVGLSVGLGFLGISQFSIKGYKEQIQEGNLLKRKLEIQRVT